MNNDIAFCTNKTCPARNKCRRGNEPKKPRVCFDFKYTPVDDGKEVICSGWWSMTNDKH
jgi:hypothetical protein